MPVATLEVEVDHSSVLELSTDYPGREFHLFDHHHVENGRYVVLESADVPSEVLLPYFERDPRASDFELLYTDDHSSFVLFCIERAHAYRAMFTVGAHTPLKVRSGWIRDEINGSREQLSYLLDRFDEANIEYRLISVTESNNRAELLTTRQREVIQVAIDRGYYQTPRKCTLADLANELDAHKSTVGSVLVRAENRIITRFMSDPPL